MNNALTREIIRHQEALVKWAFTNPPINQAPHAAAYPEMRRDATVSACLEGIKGEILARRWFFAADHRGQVEIEEKDLVEQCLAAEIETALDNALDALGSGFVPLEIAWKHKRGKGFVLDAFADVDPDQIALNVDDQMRIVSYISSPNFGEKQTLHPNKLWFHRHKPGRRFPAGQPILEPAWRPWYAKDQIIRLWGLSMQRFGMPLFVAQVPETQTSEEYEAIREAFYQLQVDGVAMISDTIAYQKHDPPAYANLSYHEFYNVMDGAIRRGLLLADQGTAVGASASVTTGQGAAELAKTSRYAMTMWARELCTSMRKQVLCPLYLANYGEARPVPYLHLEGMTNTDPDTETLRGGNPASSTGGSN